MNILNSADTAATINLITRNARGTTTTSDGATAAGLTAKENLSHLISGGFDMPHPTSIFEGVPPFSFISNGDPLVNWIIYGNTGGVGEKTDNIFNKDETAIYNAYFDNNGEWRNSDDSRSIKISCLPNTQYTLSIPNSISVFRIYESSNPDLEPGVGSRGTVITRSANISEYTFTTSETAEIIMFQGSVTSVDEWFNGLMLNTGDTALSYEPYGYKIPVVCGGVTTNIYIDEPLTAGETITYNETGVIIPTRTFLNTLSVGTTVQPAKVFIEYVK